MPDPIAPGANPSPTIQDPAAQPAPTPQAAAPTPPTSTASAATPPFQEVKLPEPSYAVMPSAREESEEGFKASGHFHPTIHKIIDGDLTGGSESAHPEALPDGPSVIAQSSAVPTKTYAAIGTFLGLVVGLTAAVYFLYPNNANTPLDMGTVTANEYGLQGHLSTRWTQKATYNLTIEPSTPAMRPALIAAVNTSTRPLSMNVQLKDPFGAVLCGTTVLVKFDPRNAAGQAAEPVAVSAKPGRKPSASEQASAESRAEVARAVNLARLESLELQREHDKDVFQPVAGFDGQVASLAAQGTLPCSKKQLDGTASWTFVPDFPVVAPLPAVAGAGSAAPGTQQATMEQAAQTLEAKRTQARRSRQNYAPVSPYSVEGIDSIIWYDAPSGTAETSAGKAFRLDPNGAAAAVLKGRDFPVVIHYECDETQGCTFTGVGLGVLHARLSR